jgi:hypothetical protein
MGASIKQQMVTAYKKGDFYHVCALGLRYFSKIQKNEDLVSLYAYSCLKSDYIDRLAVPAMVLKRSKSARRNASLFMTLVLQKKLLYHALLDGIDISNLVLPQTDHILSKIFLLYSQKKFKKDGKKYIFKDNKEKGVKYMLFLEPSKNDKPIKMIIEKYKNGVLTEKHKYW